MVYSPVGFRLSPASFQALVTLPQLDQAVTRHLLLFVEALPHCPPFLW